MDMKLNRLLARVCAWGLLSLFAATAPATTLVRTTGFDYHPNTGLLLKEVVEPADASLCSVTVRSIDSFGRVDAITRRNCNGSAAQTPGSPTEASSPAAPLLFPTATTRFGFTADHRFVGTETDAANDPVNYAYDSRFGGQTRRVDANGLATEWRYDGFGRVTVERRPDGTGARWEYRHCAAVVTGGSEACPTVQGQQPAYVVIMTPLRPPIDLEAPATASAGGPTVKNYFNAFDGLLRVDTEGFDGSGSSQIVLVDTTRDDRNNVSTEYRPYYSGSSTTTTRFFSDQLGRVRSTVQQVGDGTRQAETRVDYEGSVIVRRDARGNVTRERMDAAGNMIEVVDAKQGVMTKAYDPHGNLVEVTDARGNVTSFVYDALGRKIANYDPDAGVSRYVYNPLGHLVRSTDGRQQTVAMEYDVLGRMVRRSSTDHDASWFYGRYADASVACANARGKLCESRGANGFSRRIAYDTTGRVSSVTTTQEGGTSHTVGRTYDTLGRPDAVTYPGGFSVKHRYTPRLGYLVSILDGRNDSPLWTVGAMNAAGQVTAHSYGNGVAGAYGYTVEGRLNALSSPPLSYELVFDLTGNLESRTESAAGVSASYSHDELNRLRWERRSGGALTGTVETAWAYDAIGNLESRTEGGMQNLYAYGASGRGSRWPRAVASVAGTVNGYSVPMYRYDDAGNMLSGAGRTFNWSTFGRLSSAARGDTRLEYLYDPDYDRAQERRWRSGALDTTKTYVNGAGGTELLYEEESGSAGTRRTHYITAAGSPVAMVVHANGVWTTQYLHKDHLGSIAAVTGGQGTVIERFAYEPYGKRRLADGRTDANGTLTGSSTDRGYTGHEHLDEIGLVHMNGRIYDAALGRVLSPDPVIRSAASMQSFNPYSYVENNPLVNSDPTGNEVWPTQQNENGMTVRVQTYNGSNWFTGPSIMMSSAAGGQGASPLSIGAWASSSQYLGDRFVTTPLASASASPAMFSRDWWEQEDPYSGLTRRQANIPWAHPSVVRYGSALAAGAVWTEGWIRGDSAMMSTGADAFRELGFDRVTTNGVLTAVSLGMTPRGGGPTKGASTRGVALEEVVARRGGEVVDGGARFASRRQARQAASELAGNLGSDVQAIRMRDFKQADVPWGLRGSNRVIGRQSADGLSGWRDDFLGHPQFQMGPHVNVWTNGASFHFFY